MKVTLFPCGPAANESELKAFDRLRSSLQSTEGDDEWVLLTNLTFSVTHQLQSSEIDIVAIGPPGVRVIEVKHWTAPWVDSHEDLVIQEADRLTNKARKIGTTLRKIVSDLPHVEGAILLTQQPSKVKRHAGKVVRGVRFHTLNQWKDAIGFDSRRSLSAGQVRMLSRAMEPKIAVAMDGSLRRLAGYVNLELHTAREERFHRIYKGSHSARQDRVILHLYDLSANDDTNAEVKAKREFEALRRLQLHTWAPRILDSYQDAPGYAGEMYFFTVVDPAAPCIKDRASDETWDTTNRLALARSTVRALAELHGTKIPSDISVASSGIPLETREWEPTVAPEVRAQGLSAADQRSDVYSLCASLAVLFQGREDDPSRRAMETLARGSADTPEERVVLQDLDASLAELLGESIPPPRRHQPGFGRKTKLYASTIAITGL